MLSTPKLEHRDEQHCVAIRVTVTMQEIAVKVPPLPDEVIDWLAGQGIEPAGPPFFRYLTIDMERSLVIEAGVAVASAVTGDGRFLAGSFPSGTYVTAIHTGHPDELEKATGELLSWAADNGITWAVSDSPAGEVWAARTEFYLTDDKEEPDMNNWETELAFLTKEGEGAA